MVKEKDGNIFSKIIMMLGFVFALLFIFIQLVPLGLGVNFTVPSYIIFAVWVALGAILFVYQFLIKKKDPPIETSEESASTE